MAELFISYSHADNAFAQSLQQYLTDRGLSVVFLDVDPDSGLQPGADWCAQLIAELRRACCDWTALAAEEPHMRLERLETTLTAYLGWLQQSGFRIDRPVGDLEFLLDVNAPSPTSVSATETLRISIGSRGLCEVGSTGEVLAVISHRERDWRQWYPGLIS